VTALPGASRISSGQRRNGYDHTDNDAPEHQANLRMLQDYDVKGKMMPTTGRIKPGFVHIRAFFGQSRDELHAPTPVSSPGLTGRSSIPRRWAEPKGKGRGVLDTPLSRSMTVSGEGGSRGLTPSSSHP
jgi:hypothetical protein